TREEDFVSRLFVASTHTPVLFFSSHGRVYKEKVWRLPQAAPQARGKALINILPLEQGETITTLMPPPEDENALGQVHVMFATTSGNVRRNKLSDFVKIRPSGIIAMKLDEGDAIVDVQICTENDDVLLTASGGQCIRFPVTDVRVFQGRSSDGVRGISLAQGDRVSRFRSCGTWRRAPTSARRISSVRVRFVAASTGRRRKARPTPKRRAVPSSSASSAMWKCRRPSSSCSRSPSAATASARRPTNTASPVAAEKASSPWMCASATARSGRKPGS